MKFRSMQTFMVTALGGWYFKRLLRNKPDQKALMSGIWPAFTVVECLMIDSRHAHVSTKHSISAKTPYPIIQYNVHTRTSSATYQQYTNNLPTIYTIDIRKIIDFQFMRCNDNFNKKCGMLPKKDKHLKSVVSLLRLVLLVRQTGFYFRIQK